MKATELILALARELARHGDFDIRFVSPAPAGFPEEFDVAYGVGSVTTQPSEKFITLSMGE